MFVIYFIKLNYSYILKFNYEIYFKILQKILQKIIQLIENIYQCDIYCFIESIKCHHDNISDYIKNNFSVNTEIY